MIQPQTILNIADNTGAKKILCIRVLGGNKKYANIGDIIIGAGEMSLLGDLLGDSMPSSSSCYYVDKV